MNPDGDPLTDDAADIINISLSSSNSNPNSLLSQMINQAVEAGILVTVAAGNHLGDLFSIYSPGNANRALTVAASEGISNIADFSSRGYIKANGHGKPEIAAPGVSINATALSGEHNQLSGTSMASAMMPMKSR